MILGELEEEKDSALCLVCDFGDPACAGMVCKVIDMAMVACCICGRKYNKSQAIATAAGSYEKDMALVLVKDKEMGRSLIVARVPFEGFRDVVLVSDTAELTLQVFKLWNPAGIV